MQEINKLVSVCEEDLDMLDEQTKDLVDAAALTRTNDAICKPLPSFTCRHQSSD